MGKIEEAKEILKAMGLPQNQQNEISALTLLTLCGVAPDDEWSQARKQSLGVKKIMTFMKEKYRKSYAENTRESVRKNVLHHFLQAGIAVYNPDDPNLPTNSPLAHYAITKAALSTIVTYGTSQWENAVKQFISQQGALIEIYRKARDAKLIPVELADGKILTLSPGKHNELQVAVIKEFAPRFAPGAKLLYLGDTANKKLYLDEDGLKLINIAITDHDKLPDILLYDSNRNWLFLIEVVTSHGPMTPKRIIQLEKMLVNCSCGKIYITAFLDFGEFRKHLKSIAWETEVWIAEIPDHMIHYNGDKFLGPR
jgi:type II restriction enzyme